MLGDWLRIVQGGRGVRWTSDELGIGEEIGIEKSKLGDVEVFRHL